MIYNLKNFQIKAVSEVSKSIVDLINKNNDNNIEKTCIFQSPTGSGKTLMMAKSIQDILNEVKNMELVFLWITIGKGDLHYHSKKRLEKYLKNFVKVDLLEKEYNGFKKEIDPESIVVSNWEKLRQKDKSGQWKNTLMKDGEHENFIQLIENTSVNKKIILIIDESHLSSNTDRANELRKIISPNVTVEVSATPTIKPTNLEISNGFAKIITVAPKDVIDEGLIKKDLIINPDIRENDELDSLNLVLECAFKIKSDLNERYKKINSKVNPLVLIQIPNSSSGESYLSNILSIFRKKKIDKKKVAIWLSENKTDNLFNIEKNDNEVDFLIFKQAIDTGWDCPRAQILVKLREDNSEVFEIQTLGRILRMPEAKHYADEKLNFGYICTDQNKIIVKKEDYNPNIIKSLKSFIKADVESLNLESTYLPRVDYGDITYDFEDVFEQEFSNYFELNLNEIDFEKNIKCVQKKINIEKNFLNKALIADAKIELKDFDLMEQIDFKDSKTISAKIFAEELHYAFLEWIKENITPYQSYKRSVPRVKNAIYNSFNKFLGSSNWEDEIFTIQSIILNKQNNEIFKNILNKSVIEFKKNSFDIISTKKNSGEEKINFNIPEISYFNEYEYEKNDYNKYSHDPCYLKIDRSNPEKEFEKFIDNNPNIHWWWKNGESRSDFFSIKYANSKNIVSCFYPDYIIKLKNNSLAILEVKDREDRDGDADTKLKAEALQKYVEKNKSNKILGGIVIKFINSWMINQKTIYNWSKTKSDNLEDWISFDNFCK